MKNKIVIYIGVALILGGIGGYLVKQSKPNQSGDTQYYQANGSGRGNRNGQNGQPNRGNCLSDDCLAVENLEYPAGELSDEVKTALDEAINDEYKAMSTYQAVINKFGQVRPFSMIIGAENQHIASLKAIYDKYGLPIPENDWLSKVSAPATFKDACQLGVDAEVANAALYKDKLLPSVVTYDDITQVFTNLMNASQDKHLPAFERCN